MSGHGFWWNSNGWARCECGEYLCVVGRVLSERSKEVADGALETHRLIPVHTDGSTT